MTGHRPADNLAALTPGVGNSNDADRITMQNGAFQEKTRVHRDFCVLLDALSG